MPNVIVTINASDAGHPVPNPVRCDGFNQTIEWRLVPSATAFDKEPIRFPHPPPSGFDSWPGGTVTVSGNTASVDVHKQLGQGQKQKYKYTVVLADGKQFDPEIENTGVGDDPKHSRH
jgi:hypothetical protein